MSTTATVTVTVTNCPSPNIVASVADSGDCSRRDVVSKASTGDTLTFDERIKGQTIRLASQITIDKDLTLEGGTQQVILNGDSDGDGTGDVGLAISNSKTVVLNKLYIVKGSLRRGEHDTQRARC